MNKYGRAAVYYVPAPSTEGELRAFEITQLGLVRRLID